jgi:RimJ/RimL family protein N-acetyltransferase
VRPGEIHSAPASVAEIIDGMAVTQRSCSPETAQYWPVAGLRLRLELPRGSAGAGLELRPPDDADLTALAGLAEAGIHDPSVQPFAVAWTDADPAVRARSVCQYHWRCLGAWTPVDWTLNLAVVCDGIVVGTQELSATDFAVLREVGTGSWLGQLYQGQGIGTAMRAAALCLAFDGLGARYALSDAFTDNAASLGVSRKLGYAEDGMARHVIRGQPVESRRLRLDRESWQAAGGAPGLGFGEVVIQGLEPCLPLFGLG